MRVTPIMFPLVYVAHPFGGAHKNLDRAERWCACLSRRIDAVFIAPWVSLRRHWSNNGAFLDRGMRLDIQAIAHCDAVLMVGGRVSSGMLHERDEAVKMGKLVLDYSILNAAELLDSYETSIASDLGTTLCLPSARTSA